MHRAEKLELDCERANPQTVKAEFHCSPLSSVTSGDKQKQAQTKIKAEETKAQLLSPPHAGDSVLRLSAGKQHAKAFWERGTADSTRKSTAGVTED